MNPNSFVYDESDICGTGRFSENLQKTFNASVIGIDPSQKMLNVAETPAALPGGLIECGEDPAKAAIRETLEETGLESEIVQCLGWFLSKNFAGYPGPLITFRYETRATGGKLQGSDEGKAKIFPQGAFPEIICPELKGSWRAITTYLSRITL